MTQSDALKRYEADLFSLGKEADAIRRAQHEKKVFFNLNRHINPTNVCADYCRFCGFSSHRKNPNPYTLSIDEAVSQAIDAQKAGAKELHVVSAHNRAVGLEWYFDLFKAIKAACGDLHLKAMTAAEVEFLARTYDLSFDQVLDRMVESGVDSMPGGGAEIFDETIRDYLCKGKVSSEQWLSIHEKWHSKGRKSNATMLFGHVEDPHHRIDHLFRLAELQAKTGGFNAFIPLLYLTENNFLSGIKPAGAEEILKTIAISRIVLEEIPHIKAYWVMLGINLALVAQHFGADDIDGTIQKESIGSAAGAKSASGLDQKSLIDLIKNAGYLPVERDSLYNELRVYG
jgi:aminodeoxyfutalosine synthase